MNSDRILNGVSIGRQSEFARLASKLRIGNLYSRNCVKMAPFHFGDVSWLLLVLVSYHGSPGTT